jgi:hypothetical protein
VLVKNSTSYRLTEMEMEGNQAYGRESTTREPEVGGNGDVTYDDIMS